jgi:hypothetical protein
MIDHEIGWIDSAAPVGLGKNMPNSSTPRNLPASRALLDSALDRCLVVVISMCIIQEARALAFLAGNDSVGD